MHIPRVSVLLPVYGVERTLAACLDSVLDQTVQDFEVICVNDGSTDGSAAILNTYAARDPRVTIIAHESNRGLAATRNTGLNHARGECVLFVDTDDRIHRQTLALTLDAMARHDADVVAFKPAAVSECDPDRHEESEHQNIETAFVTDHPFRAMLDKRVNVFVWNKLYRRRVFGSDLRFDERQRVSQDQGILPLIMLRSRRLVQLKNRLYYYFNNPGSLSNHVRPWTVTSHILEGYLFADYLARYPMERALRDRFRQYTAKSVFQAVDIVFSRVPAGVPEEKRLLSLFVEECRKLLDKQVLSLRDFSLGRLLVLVLLLNMKEYGPARQLWFLLRRVQNPLRKVPRPKALQSQPAFNPVAAGV